MTLDQAADAAIAMLDSHVTDDSVYFTLVGDGGRRRCRWVDPWMRLFEFAYDAAPVGVVTVDDVRNRSWIVVDQRLSIEGVDRPTKVTEMTPKKTNFEYRCEFATRFVGKTVEVHALGTVHPRRDPTIALSLPIPEYGIVLLIRNVPAATDEAIVAALRAVKDLGDRAWAVRGSGNCIQISMRDPAPPGALTTEEV